MKSAIKSKSHDLANWIQAIPVALLYHTEISTSFIFLSINYIQEFNAAAALNIYMEYYMAGNIWAWEYRGCKMEGLM